MQTLNLKVKDSYFSQFLVLIDKLVKDKKVEIIDNEFPQHLLVSSKEEVRRRVREAENRVKNGEFLTEEEYNNVMDDLFKNKLGVDR